jgi:hypothetical protein
MLKNYLMSTALYAPEGVAGGSSEERIPINERPVDGPGSGRSALRKQLEKNFEDDRGQRDEGERRPKPQRSRARQEAEETEEEPEAEEVPAGEQAEAETEGTETQEQATPAPEAWSKEAKAEWASVPPNVQKAVLKREADITKGVNELKGRYAEIDKVLGHPHRTQLLQRTGKSAAEAIDQLFSWHEALSGKPELAFPALAESFGFDLRKIPGLVPAGQPAAGDAQPEKKPDEATDAELPPTVRNYIQKLESKLNEFTGGIDQRLKSFQDRMAQESYAKTQNILEVWSKDKQYFTEEVRKEMAKLIGSGVVAPLPNGDVDASVLDSAYERALWSLSDVRSQMLSDQQKAADDAQKAKLAAEKKAQKEQADKARRASGSIVTSAPGAPVAEEKKGKKGKSVKESLHEAMDQLQGRA